MKSFLMLGMAALALTAGLKADVRGHYIESRNAEIYASHCFANSEAGIKGDLAVMAWQIEEGAVDGVQLDGLNVVAVVRASATLGDPFADPLPTKSLLIFDERANPEQRQALETFVNRASAGLVREVAAREAAPITVDFHGDLHAKRASLTAGNLVKLETRPIEKTDSLCHLDNIYYGPLVELDHAMPAFALVSSFQGDGLGVKLDDYNRSSVYLGSFEMADARVSD